MFTKDVMSSNDSILVTQRVETINKKIEEYNKTSLELTSTITSLGISILSMVIWPTPMTLIGGLIGAAFSIISIVKTVADRIKILKEVKQLQAKLNFDLKIDDVGEFKMTKDDSIEHEGVSNPIKKHYKAKLVGGKSTWAGLYFQPVKVMRQEKPYQNTGKELLSQLGLFKAAEEAYRSRSENTDEFLLTDPLAYMFSIRTKELLTGKEIVQKALSRFEDKNLIRNLSARIVMEELATNKDIIDALTEFVGEKSFNRTDYILENLQELKDEMFKKSQGSPLDRWEKSEKVAFDALFFPSSIEVAFAQCE